MAGSRVARPILAGSRGEKQRRGVAAIMFGSLFTTETRMMLLLMPSAPTRQAAGPPMQSITYTRLTCVRIRFGPIDQRQFRDRQWLSVGPTEVNWSLARRAAEMAERASFQTLRTPRMKSVSELFSTPYIS